MVEAAAALGAIRELGHRALAETGRGGGQALEEPGLALLAVSVVGSAEEAVGWTLLALGALSGGGVRSVKALKRRTAA